MDIAEVKARVAAIEASKRDAEAAHGIEDQLYIAVLNAIAAGAPNAVELAKAALKANDIEFARRRA